MPGWAWLLIGLVGGAVLGYIGLTMYLSRSFRSFL